MKKLFTLSIITLSLLTSCGGSISEAHEKGFMYAKWTFKDIEPYKKGEVNEDFIKKVKVTPIELDFSEAEENGHFIGFFPNMDKGAADYFVSRDIAGKVEFDLNNKGTIYTIFSDIECDYDFKMDNFFIHELSEDEMVVRLSGPRNLYVWTFEKQ